MCPRSTWIWIWHAEAGCGSLRGSGCGRAPSGLEWCRWLGLHCSFAVSFVSSVPGQVWRFFRHGPSLVQGGGWPGGGRFGHGYVFNYNNNK